jgi:diguanylate cyclase (GGDEF)-like protein
LKNTAPLIDPADFRRQAEERLRKKKQSQPPQPVTETEALRLLHELQVHQIELEMQNEELLQVREDLELALRQYIELYDFAPVGFATLTQDSTILNSNLAFSYLLGRERKTLVNRRFGSFVAIEYQTSLYVFLDKMFSSGNKETVELVLKQGTGDPKYIQLEAIVDFSGKNEDVCNAVIVDITKLKEAEGRLRNLATHDSLTGLYNRSFFMEELARLERGRSYPVSLVMADVDHLKETNDLHGHAAGDKLLKLVASVLLTVYRDEDVVARIGGDEFAVILPNTETSTADSTLQRVRDTIKKFNSDQQNIPVHLSLGAATATSAALFKNLIHQADSIMYQDKRTYHESVEYDKTTKGGSKSSS